MSETEETTAKTDQSNTRKGEESFNEEIKDYAKTTMNELLGMFGYDDEITSESVNNLDIKVPTTSEESSTASSSVTTVTNTTPSLPLNVPDDADDDTPVIVKVEGNTTVNDVIRKQNDSNGRTNVTAPPSTSQAAPVVTQTKTDPPSSMNVTMTTQSETGQPTLAPHFYAVPPAVRGLYCVVANLPLVVNQSKSAMTFKFWNCITCSEYFLQKPEVVFRIHYPHLFTGQPDWLYQAAVCLKCYHNLPAPSVSKTTSVPDLLTHGTFTVIDCKTEKECTTTMDSKTSGATTVNSTCDTITADERTTPDADGGNPPSTDGGNPPSTETLENNVGSPSKATQSIGSGVPNGKETANVKGNHLVHANHQKHEISTVRGIPSSNSLEESYKGSPSLNTTLPISKESRNLPSNNIFQISQDTAKRSPTLKTALETSQDPGNPLSNLVTENTPMLITKVSPLYSHQAQTERNKVNNIETIDSNSTDDQESYKCYVCKTSVSFTSPHGKLRRSKFPSLFTNVPDNVGHFKVCQLCFDHLDQQREQYVKASVPDEERNYSSFVKHETTGKLQDVNLCFVCESVLDKEPCRLVFRSRYPSMFRGLPENVTYVPLCDKCYKKLQKVKLRYDRSQSDEESRNYIHFVNLWRAKRGLGSHPVLV